MVKYWKPRYTSYIFIKIDYVVCNKAIFLDSFDQLVFRIKAITGDHRVSIELARTKPGLLS